MARPRKKGKETEDDLLRAQESFRQDMDAPAAKAFRRAPPKIQASAGGESKEENVKEAKQSEKRVSFAENEGRDGKKIALDPIDVVEKDVVSLGPIGLPAEAPIDVLPLKPRSVFAARRQNQQHVEKGQEEVEGLVDEEEGEVYEHPHEKLDRADTHITNILSHITEREPQEGQWRMPAFKRTAFPVAQKRVVNETPGPGFKGRSIFALDHDRRSQKREFSQPAGDFSAEKDVISLDFAENPVDVSKLSLQNKEISGVGDSHEGGYVPLLERVGVSKEEREAVHSENMQRLAGMTLDEIEEARAEIMEKMDPNLLIFFKNRKSGKIAEKGVNAETKGSANEEGNQKEITGNDEIGIRKEVLEEGEVLEKGTRNEKGTEEERKRVKFDSKVEKEEEEKEKQRYLTVDRGEGPISIALTTVKVDEKGQLPVKLPIRHDRKWVHMNELEVEKFDWMQDTSVPAHGPLAELSRRQREEDRKAAAESRVHFVRTLVRFDFSGLIIPADVDISTDHALHHHGDDEGYAGYTIKELVHLMRSAVPAQRSLSLSVTANIIHQLLDGMYDDGVHVVVDGQEHDVTARDLIAAFKAAGYVVGLRLALDDSKDSVLLSAVAAFSCWLAADYSTTPDEDPESPPQRPIKQPEQVENDEKPLTKEEKEERETEESMEKARGKLYPASSVGDFSACTRYRAYESPTRDLPPFETGEENEDKVTDEDIAKHDAVQGYLAMNVLPRLRYILEVCRLRMAVDHVFDILLRIASYSLEAAHAIYDCPRLMEHIHKEFISPPWPPAVTFPPREYPYGCPHPKALQLLRTLCISDRSLAQRLVRDGYLLSTMQLVCVDPTTHHTTEGQQELSLCVCLEAYQLWRVTSLYGFADAPLLDLYPILLNHLNAISHMNIATVAPIQPVMSLHLAWGASVLNLLEAMLHVATARTRSKSNDVSMGVGGEEGKMDERDVPMEGVVPSHLLGLFEPVAGMCVEWLQALEETVSSSESTPRSISAEYIDLCSSACHCISAFFSLLSRISKGDLSQDTFSTAVNVMKNGFVPMLGGVCAEWGIAHAVQWVDQVSVGWAGDWADRSAQSRRPLRSIPAELAPIIEAAQEKCMGGLLLRRQAQGRVSICNFLLGVARGTRGALGSGLLPTTLLPAILTAIFPSKADTRGGVWYRFILGRVVHHTQGREARPGGTGDLVARTLRWQGWLHNSTILLANALLPHISLHPSSSLDEATIRQSLHRHSMWLLTCLQAGSDYEAVHLLNLVCLAPQYLSALHECALRGKHGQQVGQLLVGSNLLQQLGAIYSSHVATQRALQLSQARATHTGTDIDSLLLPSPAIVGDQGSHLPLPIDWVFIPLINIYNTMVDYRDGAGGVQALPKETVGIVGQALQLVLLMELGTGSYISAVGTGIKIARLMCVFNLGADVYRDDTVHALLDALLTTYTTASGGSVDFSRIPGVPFYDLYMEFLTHYAGVSFGDRVFQRYAILPLQQTSPSSLRRLLWGECADAVSTLTLSPADLPAPIEHYLFPLEEDRLVLGLYLRAITDGTVWKGRAPLPYWIAVHHLTGHLFGATSHTPLTLDDPKIALFAEALTSPNQAVVHDIFSYFYTGPGSFPSDTRPVIPPRRMEVIGRLRAQLIEQQDQAQAKGKAGNSVGAKKR